MRRRSFLLGALLAPIAAALRLGGEQLKIVSAPGTSIPFEWAEEDVVRDLGKPIALHRKPSAIRSTVTWQPVRWYEVGDIIELEGKSYEIVRTETHVTDYKVGSSNVCIYDAYLRELREELAPKAAWPKFSRGTT